MIAALFHRQLAQALVDRAAFAIESAAVAGAVIVLLGLSAARFDVLAAALVWGSFWRRFAEVESPVRAPVVVAMVAGGILVTLIVAMVRWPKASLAFASFPARPSFKPPKGVLRHEG